MVGRQKDADMSMVDRTWKGHWVVWILDHGATVGCKHELLERLECVAEWIVV